MKYGFLALFLLLCASPAFAQLPTPVLTPSTGSYVGTTAVGITDSNASAVICYTLNGSSPTAAVAGTCDSNAGAEFTYLVPDLISSTTTVKAIATLAANTNSAIASAVITITTPSATDGPAALPQGWTNACGVFCTNFPDTTGYTVVTVCASSCTYSNYATALSSVSCGTVIKLTAGQSFQGSFTINQACDAAHWIVTISSDCTSLGVCTHLPAQGTRVTPSLLAYMSTLSGVNTNNTPTLNVGVNSGSGAAYYWFGPGIEITGPADGIEFNGLGLIQDSPSSGGAPLVKNITFDRDYIHCQPGQQCTRGAQFAGISEALVDSYVTDFHSLQSTQSQGWWISNYYGPIKIVNNYIGGASEVIMSGGSGCAPTGIVPSDVEIAGNNLIYSFGTVGFIAGNVGNIRDILEIKEGRRVLIQGNYMDATPIAGLNSNALNTGILFYVAQCSGGTDAPWITTQDITARYNSSLSSTSGLIFGGGNEGGVTPPATAAGYFNFSVHDSLFDNINTSNGQGFTDQGLAISADDYPPTENVTINHNTFISSASDGSHGFSEMFCGNVAPTSQVQGSFNMTNNLGFNGRYGTLTFWNGGSGASLTQCFPGAFTWTKNAQILLLSQSPSDSIGLPAGNLFPANVAAVGFTNFNSGSGGNYQLTGGSTYHNAGTDGKDLGVSNYSCFNTVIALAIAGTYTESGASCLNGSSGGGTGTNIPAGVTIIGVTVH